MKTVSFSFCDFLCHRVRYTALLLRRSFRWPRCLYGHNEKKPQRVMWQKGIAQ